MNAIEARVLHLIGENVSSPDVFVDTEDGMRPIRDSINDAVQEITVLTGSNKRQYFLPLREGQMFYRLFPDNGYVGWVSDVWSVDRQYRLDQTDIIKLNSEDPRWMTSNGFPQSYMQIGADILGVYPKPSGSNGTLEITIVEVPVGYSHDRDPVKLRESFRHALVSYAVSDFWASRGDAMEAQKHYADYLQALGLREKYIPHAEAKRSFRTNA